MSASSASSIRESTTAYLNAHQIPLLLEQALSRLAKEKPSDPYLFLSEEFRNLSVKKQNATDPVDTANADRKPQVVFVLGGPGAGKGTQCANIVQEFGFVHLSAGDLLREARNLGDETGKMIDHYIKEGQIVPVEVTVGLIKRSMELNISQGKYNFLVDGFPRNHDNLEGWHRVMGDFAIVAFVLFFDCPEDVMEQRLLKRGETSGRTDDNIDSIRKRFKTYVESTKPIIDQFTAEGKCHKVLATQSVDKVYADVKKIFQGYQW